MPEVETAFLREVLDAVSDAIYFVDSAGVVVDVNRGACAQLGYARDELVGMPASRITATPGFDFEALHGRVLDRGHVTVETEHVRKDGTRLPVEVTITRVVHDGRPFIVGISRDVTERRAAAAALMRSEHNYRSLVENLPGQLAIMFDRDLRFLLVDGPEVEPTRFSKSHMEGRRLREALPPEFCDAVEPNMRRVLAGERFSAELPFEDRTYHYEYVPLRGRDGEVERGLIIGQNVTERVRATRAITERELQYRTLAEHLPDLVVRFDRAHRIVFANPVLERAVGVDVASALGKTLRELGLPEGDAASWDAALDRVFVTGEPGAREDVVASPTGPRQWAARLVPERAETAVETVLVLSRDVTDERRAEEERRALEVKLHQAGKLDALGRLAGGVAHDFNNLLTVIASYVDLILGTPSLEPHLREDLTEILAAVRRGSSLTTQLLAFSRKHVTAPSYVDLDVLVEQALRMLQRLLGEDIAIEFTPGSGDVVLVDPSQIEQVLLNLAANARDAMPGGGRLVMATASVDVDAARAKAFGVSAGRYVRLRVADTGKGMSAETLDRVFEPFFTTKEAGRGTGLGLSITHGIILKHGGFIDVTSTLGVGSSFDIHLPAYDRARVVAGRPPEAPERTREAHILLVEDERPVLEVIARLLGARGYRVYATNTAEEALRLAADPAMRIDLLISDVIMPGTSGPQLLARLREHRPELRVLFMSGYTNDALTQAGLSASSTSFVQKPFSEASLLAKVADALERPPQA